MDPNQGYPLLCGRTRWGGISPTIPLSYYVQGTAMWWMMMGMIRCQERIDRWNRRPKIKPSSYIYMVMQVHDELVFDFPAKKDQGNLMKVNVLRLLMEKGGKGIDVPTPVSIEYHPNNWSEGVSV